VSAVCGAVVLDGRPFGPDDLAGMLAVLAPLGPHGGGTWSGPVGRLGVAVGGRLRRRVPEDAAGRLPLVSADGRVVVVADVVLDNRADLAARLGVPDRPDTPDGALVLAAYQRWGDRCPEHLLGDFVFAVVDGGRGGVLLVRDHLGNRPLNVYQRAGVLAFASTALALTGFEGVGHDLDEARLAAHLALVPAADRSWVSGVRPLGPATTLWVDATGARTRRYWTLDTVRRDHSAPQRHADALRDALDRAVTGRLRGPGAAGVMLSGGLDSTSVAASAAIALAPEPVHTYTSAPPPGWHGEPVGNWQPDESHLVKDLQRWYPNLRATLVNARGVSPFDAQEELFALGGTPSRNACNLMWVHPMVRAAARDGVSTLFCGANGNAYFSADAPDWLVRLLRAGRLPTFGRELRAWAAATGGSTAGVVKSSVVRPLIPWPPRGRSQPTRWDNGAEVRAARDAWSGLRTTDPTGDVRVLEVCAAQPAWIRRRAGMTRAGCRSAMAGRLPDSIRLRTERGMQLPDWLDRLGDARTELAAEVAAMRADPTCARFVDVARLDAALRSWPTPDAARAPDIVCRYRLELARAVLTGRYVRWFADRPRQHHHERNPR
jgi:asparagine synthase (glutamine-hydrolysing)